MSATILTVAKEVYGLYFGYYEPRHEGEDDFYKLGGSTGFIEIGEKYTVRKAVIGKDGYIEIQSRNDDTPNTVYHLSHAEFQKAFPGIDIDNIEYE